MANLHDQVADAMSIRHRLDRGECPRFTRVKWGVRSVVSAPEEAREPVIDCQMVVIHARGAPRGFPAFVWDEMVDHTAGANLEWHSDPSTGAWGIFVVNTQLGQRLYPPIIDWRPEEEENEWQRHNLLRRTEAVAGLWKRQAPFYLFMTDSGGQNVNLEFRNDPDADLWFLPAKYSAIVLGLLDDEPEWDGHLRRSLCLSSSRKDYDLSFPY